MEQEIWKDIKGYEGHYQVSNAGNIKRLHRVIKSGGKNYAQDEKIMKPSGKRYLKVSLVVNGNKKDFNVHRLVAMAFIPNPFNKTQINHKDGNKANNSIDNLEWCNPKENHEHARMHGLIVSPKANKGRYGGKSYSAKKVIQLERDTLQPLVVYPSCVDAVKTLKGRCPEFIRNAAHGVVPTAYGYKWIYLNDFKSKNPNYDTANIPAFQ